MFGFHPMGIDLNGLLPEIHLTGPFHMEGECKAIEGVSVANATRVECMVMFGRHHLFLLTENAK